MAYRLTKFLRYDGTDTVDILPSLVSFEWTNGLFPEMGSLKAIFTSPTEDTDGDPVVLSEGDIIWPYFYQFSPSLDYICPMAGYITDIRQEGDLLTVTAESLAAPFLRSTFTGSYAANPYVYAILTDVVGGYTPPLDHDVFQEFGIYRPSYGAAQVPIDAKTDDVSFDKAGVAAIYQYFSEYPAITSLASILSAAHAEYATDETGTPWKPVLYLEWSGFGNHPIAATQLTHGNGLLSPVEWRDDAESILNDVTVKIRDGQTYQKTDAASIAAYGQRATTLYRPMYTDLAYAQVHADTIVAALKDPKARCSADVDANILFPFHGVGLNWVFQVVDDTTGRSDDLTLVKVTVRWPEFIAECEFDNAALNISRYGLRMENRVSNLEDNLISTHGGFGDLQGGQPGQYYHLSQAAYNNLYQQDQGVKTTDSPTFALLNISSPSGTAMFGPANTSFCNIYTDRPAFVFDKSISCNPSSGLDLGLSNRYWRHLYMNGNLVINGSVLADASKNIAASNVTLGSDTDTTAYYLRVKRLATSEDGTLVSQLDVVVDANRGYLTFSRGGSVKAQLLADRGGYWYSNVWMQINGALQSTALNVVGGTSTSDMGRFEHTGATASDNVTFVLKRTNQTGTQLYLDLWDATNGKRGGINVGAVRINNGTVAIDANNDHMARNISASGGRMDLSGAAPLFYWAETDQTLPAGRWRMGVDGDALLIDHNTASDGLYGTRQRSYFNSNGFYCHGDVIGSGLIGGTAMATLTISASSTVQMAHDALATTYSTSMTKVKTITVNYALTGTFYVKYTLYSGHTGTTVYGRLYKNGSALSASRAVSTETGTEYTEGPFSGIASADQFQMYLQTTNASYPAGVTNFRICYTVGSAKNLHDNS